MSDLDLRRGDDFNLSSAIRFDVRKHFRSIAMRVIDDGSVSTGVRPDPGARQQARRRSNDVALHREDAGLPSLPRRRMQRQTATLHETTVSSDTTGQVSKERMERANVACAYIVVKHGPRYAPLLAKLEHEFAMRFVYPVEHAQAILDRYQASKKGARAGSRRLPGLS